MNKRRLFVILLAIELAWNLGIPMFGKRNPCTQWFNPSFYTLIPSESCIVMTPHGLKIVEIP